MYCHYLAICTPEIATLADANKFNKLTSILKKSKMPKHDCQCILF